MQSYTWCCAKGKKPDQKVTCWKIRIQSLPRAMGTERNAVDSRVGGTDVWGMGVGAKLKKQWEGSRSKVPNSVSWRWTKEGNFRPSLGSLPFSPSLFLSPSLSSPISLSLALPHCVCVCVCVNYITTFWLPLPSISDSWLLLNLYLTLFLWNPHTNLFHKVPSGVSPPKSGDNRPLDHFLCGLTQEFKIQNFMLVY